MECKYTGKTYAGKSNAELIDTLWNVNVVMYICAATLIVELIDTLWNVNFFHLPPARDSSRINRYIMECK